MKKRLSLALVIAILSGLPAVSHAGWVDKAIKKAEAAVGRVSQIDASIEFRNESSKPIKVVMDNNREIHVIKPHSSVAFKKANVGDAPTFNVYDLADQAIYGRRVNPVGVKSSLGFNGKSF